MDLSIEYLIPGMCLGEDIIIDSEPVYELKKDSKLSNRDITKISERGIQKVKIIISDEHNTFNTEFDNLVNEILKTNDFDKYKELANIYQEIAEEKESFQYDMSKYLSVDQKMHKHNVNIINMSVILTDAYNSVVEKDTRIPINIIALAAIMQDIGRTAKDEYILSRLKNKYSENIKKLFDDYPTIPKDIFENYNSQYHPIYSYFISLDYNVPNEVSLAILYHHEKELGTNSLLGVELSKLDSHLISTKMASILKVIDLFDILVSKSVLDNPEQPFKNIGKQLDKMVSGGYTNAYITNILKKVFPIYRVGTKVLLSDGTIGIVKSNDATADYVIPIVTDLNGKCIDLKTENLDIIKHYVDNIED